MHRALTARQALYPWRVNRAPTETEQSAGGVLWRPAAAGKPGVEICLIATRGSTRWQLPKGHLSVGESDAEAARREVREETGCDGSTIELTTWARSSSGSSSAPALAAAGCEERQFFLLRYAAGETRDHDGEVDEAALARRWTWRCAS